MPKTYFHNYISISENKDKKTIISSKYDNPKKNVDINKLLNSVRIENRNETKKRIIFYCLTVLGIGFFMTLLATF